MPRKIEEQVVVITGATSGIGRTTARLFAERGAKLVLGARNKEALDDLVREIEAAGGAAVAVETDVSGQQQVQALADAAIERFGRIDTWVNNAGVAVYATFDKLTDKEIRRIFDVNFMGTVHGVQAALPAMRANGGGTIINIASVAGKRALPLLSAYSASKFAVVGLGEALRAELVEEEAEINVCTVCPPSINTPFFDHARTKEGRAPRPMPPVYQPEDVAEAIISCAESPQREVIIGAAGKTLTLMNTLAPSLADWYMGRSGVEGQLTDEPKSADAPDNLFDVPPETRERGDWTARGQRGDGQTEPARSKGFIRRHPVATAAVGLAASLVAARFAFGR
jgi:short-subunit dehydrogenase